MFEEYGIEGVDCKNEFWKRREITKQMNDLTNQRFGKLIALFPIVSYKKENTKWLCKCDCGNLKVVSRALLNDGRTKSCGCIKSEMMKQKAQERRSIQIGDKYNLLTVLEYIGSRRKHNNELTAYYRCQCECGNIIEVEGNDLSSGNRKTCGLHNSVGEFSIEKILRKNNINFIHEYSFSDLVSEKGRRLRFDFALFNQDESLFCLIEYQGSQHFNYTGRQWNTKQNFQKVKFRDKQKREYCLKNNYFLYEITYKDNVEEKMEEILYHYGIKQFTEKDSNC